MRARKTGQLNGSAIVVASVCLAVQVIFLVEGRADPTFRTPIVDAGGYHEAAVRFAQGHRLIDDAFWQPPLFPLLLGCLYALAGPSVLVAKGVLAALAVGSCLLTRWIGGRIFSRRTGLIAGLLLALYGPFVFFSTQLLPTGLAVFLDLLAIALWLWSLTQRRWYSRVVFGLVSGLATITVPNAAVLVVLATITTLLLGRRRRQMRRAWGSMALTLLGFAAAIAPVTARNFLVSGEWVLISTNGGINFFVGNNPDRDETIAIRPGESWRRFARQGFDGTGRTRAEQSAYFFRRTLAYVRDQPLGFILGLGEKTVRLFNAREIPRNVDPYVHRDYSVLLSILMWRAGPFSFPFGLLAPLAAVGMVVSLHSGPRSDRARAGRIALPAFVAAYGLSIVCFFVSARYRVPMAVAMVLLAACGANWLVDWIGGRDPGVVGAGSGTKGPRRSRGTFRDEGTVGVIKRKGVTAFGGGLALVIGLVITHVPISAPTDRINFRAELALCVGDALASAGRFDRAEEFLRRALELVPRHADSGVKLAGVLAEQGGLDDAEALLREASTWDDRSAEASVLLGNLLRRRSRPSEAILAYEHAVTVDPTSPEGHAGLAALLADRGSAAKAIEHYRLAVELTEDAGPILIGLADALVQQGAYEEAIDRYRQALWHVDPEPAVLNRISWLLATCPRVELRDCRRAIEIAEHLCRATDFGHAVALDTLAAAYAECGRWADAVRWARRAIEIALSGDDPQTADSVRPRLRAYEEHLARPASGGSESPRPSSPDPP